MKSTILLQIYRGHAMFSHEKIREFIHNTPPKLKGQSFESFAKQPHIFLGKKKDHFMNAMMTIYLIGYKEKDYIIVVANGKIL